MRTILVGLAVSAALLAGAGQSAADSRIVQADPAAGSTAAAPQRVVLTFDMPIASRFVRITVTGPGGSQWAKPDARVEGAQAIAEIRGGLAEGAYTVNYRAQSEDGHSVSGAYGFAVAASPGQESAAAERRTSGAADYRGQVMWVLLALAVALPCAGLALTARRARRERARAAARSRV
jgi:methionine-rich copper-binding protein CopC